MQVRSFRAAAESVLACPYAVFTPNRIVRPIPLVGNGVADDKIAPMDDPNGEPKKQPTLADMHVRDGWLGKRASDRRPAVPTERRRVPKKPSRRRSRKS